LEAAVGAEAGIAFGDFCPSTRRMRCAASADECRTPAFRGARRDAEG
jgi:hypothetical protein